MENKPNEPIQTGAEHEPEADSGSNTILIVLLIVILLVVGFLLVQSGPAPVEAPADEAATSAPAEDDGNDTNAGVDVEVEAEQ